MVITKVKIKSSFLYDMFNKKTGTCAHYVNRIQVRVEFYRNLNIYWT